MDNLPNDIIFNICRFLPYPESKAFKNITLPIDKMILNSEFYKFYNAYADTDEDDECTWCSYNMVTDKDKELKFKHMGTGWAICFYCFYHNYINIQIVYGPRSDIRKICGELDVRWDKK